MTDAQRERFDALVEEAIGNLPEAVRNLLDEVPVIVLDQPSPKLIEELTKEWGPDEDILLLCGLHTGHSNLERTIDARGTELPSDIHLFRRGIIDLSGGWDQPEADDAVYEEILVTLLHEIGHQFGLDEDDLERLGYD